jgi:protein O-mannosyl-transferase
MPEDHLSEMLPRPDEFLPLTRRWPRAEWLFAAVLVVSTCLAYQPAWHGGMIWDDDQHVIRAELRSLHGLYRIWFDVGATQQYYPLLYTAFWIEHKFWGDSTFGYHMVNILLHAAAALLVATALRKLRVPGAYLAAAIFALHPVHVESVAWITEQKNTLSAVFYLGAALLYLHFDQTRKKLFYLGALTLFVFCLLTKTVTATLPAALLVVFWWKRGRLSWRCDIRPLVPFFILGAAAGLFTAWAERTLVGAEGPQFDLSIIDRFLIAGRVIWFYLGKLLWPSELIFIYPRWDIDSALWWQYLFPAAAILLVAVLWVLRRRWRGPLAGLLFFAGTLFPVLGFFNVYPFVFSFVADHFQYLASLGVISLVSAGISLFFEQRRLWRQISGCILCVLLLSTLAGMTWQQSRMYGNIEMLYRATIEKNPNCWMAYNNLGKTMTEEGRLSEAMDYFQQALTLKPDFAEAHNNLGTALAQRGRFQDAIEQYQQALRLKPKNAEVYINLGSSLDEIGQSEEAIKNFWRALTLNPNSPEAHCNLANAFIKTSQPKLAIEHYRQALTLDPEYLEAHNNLGIALLLTGQPQESIDHFIYALRIKPDYVNACSNLALAYARINNSAEAVAAAQKALKLAEFQGKTAEAKQIEDWLNSYRKKIGNVNPE